MKISLEAARVNAHFTKGAAGQALDRNPSTIANWEKGRTPIKSYDLQRVCQLYKVELGDLILPEVKEHKNGIRSI